MVNEEDLLKLFVWLLIFFSAFFFLLILGYTEQIKDARDYFTGR